MVFSSLVFLFRFLPVVLLIYYLAPKQFRNLILFLSSIFFYAWGEPILVCLMIFSSILDFFMGRGIGAARRMGNETLPKVFLTISLVGNLGLLAVFKYADFFISSINTVTGAEIPLLKLALPIGISFYTFQTLSYTIDVYRGQVKPQRNFIAFAAYVTLFPQLIAGPIVRYKTVARELRRRKESLRDFSSGAFRFVIGLSKKVLIANSVGAVFDEVAAMNSSELSTMTAWLGVVAFTFQIYFDFSGYSDMAIGLGRMFGFHFLENFEHPYESTSITEFWRRWHISLGTWFKEYVYIPLGGNRRGFKRQVINIAIVWFLTGMWHGASWNFVLWGVYYGILLVLEKLFLLDKLEKLPGILTHCYTMVLVVIGWAFFSFSDVKFKGDFLSALLFRAGGGFADSRFVYLLLSNLVMFLIAAIGSTSIPMLFGKRVFAMSKRKRALVVGLFMGICLMLSLCSLVSDTYNPFLYFRF
ncbi:MAG: MBOAT family protein [Lachnospiraceae bacterium]|nr:MBOAT family protein [Lachnospiraceae bacterium]